jgi:hypothetical protein
VTFGHSFCEPYLRFIGLDIPGSTMRTLAAVCTLAVVSSQASASLYRVENEIGSGNYFTSSVQTDSAFTVFATTALIGGGLTEPTTGPSNSGNAFDFSASLDEYFTQSGPKFLCGQVTGAECDRRRAAFDFLWLLHN